MTVHLKLAIISEDPAKTIAELKSRLPDYVVVNDGTQLHSLTGHILVNGPFPSYLFSDSVERDSITINVLTPDDFNKALSHFDKIQGASTEYYRSLKSEFNSIYTHEGDRINFYGGASISNNRNPFDHVAQIVERHWERYVNHQTMFYYPVKPMVKSTGN